MPINISNEKQRDAVVAMEGVRPKRDVRYVDEEMNAVFTRRLLKTDVTHELPELMKKLPNFEDVSEALVDADPEIDTENFGMFLTETSRVYVGEGGIVHSVEEYEVVTNPDGTERERRPRKKEPQNINTDVPLKWTGKFIKKSDAVKRFVFAGKKQIAHINGLTFDFLFEIAKKLHDEGSLLLLRAGEHRDRPLIMNRGGKPYNAFLEGRIESDSYCLIMHLSNMELKRPVPKSDDSGPARANTKYSEKPEEKKRSKRANAAVKEPGNAASELKNSKAAKKKAAVSKAGTKTSRS